MLLVLPSLPLFMLTPLVAEKSLVQKYKRKLAGRSWDHDWNPTYAAMIETVDTNVGRLYKAIQSAGIADATLFIFTSDNGGVSAGDGKATSNLPLRGGKGRQWEGGIREPYCIAQCAQEAGGAAYLAARLLAGVGVDLDVKWS